MPLLTPALIIWTTAMPHSVWWSVWCLTETVQMWFNIDNKKDYFLEKTGESDETDFNIRHL